MSHEPFARSEAFFQPGHGIYQGWRTSLGSIVGLVLGPSVVLSLCYGVFAPYLRDAFGWTIADVGWGVSITEIMVTVVSLISGVMLDRFGARRLILISIPLFGLGFAALSRLDGSLSQFYAALVVLPLIATGVWPGAWIKATSSWFDRRLGLAVAVTTLGIGFGAVIMPVVINQVAEVYGWRSAYLYVGLGSIVVGFPLAYALVRDAPRRTLHSANAASPFKTGDYARSRPLWTLALAFAGLGVFTSAGLVNLIGVLEANGMARQQAVEGLSALGGATMAGRLLSGWLLDRFRINFVIPIIAAAAAAAIFALSLGLAGAAAYACAVSMGLLVGAEIDVLGFSVKRFFGSAHYGTIFGFLFAVFHIGGAIGAYVMGIGSRFGGGYAPGLTVASLATFGAAILFASLPRYPDTSSTELAV